MLLVGGCVAQQPNSNNNPAFPTGTVMARIQSEGRLLVAVPYEGRPPQGEENPSLTVYRGFAVELAREVADSLDVPVRFTPSATSAVSSLSESSSIHISFALTPVTDRLIEKSTLTDPYLISNRRLLVDRGSDIKGLNDLSGRRVCFIVEQATTVVAEELGASVQVIKARENDCLELLRNNEVAAVVGLDVDLARVIADSEGRWTVVGRPIDTVALAAVVPRDARAFADYVSRVFDKAEGQDRWSRWYEEWIGAYVGGPAPPPPDISLGEAADLED